MIMPTSFTMIEKKLLLYSTEVLPTTINNKASMLFKHQMSFLKPWKEKHLKQKLNPIAQFSLTGSKVKQQMFGPWASQIYTII